MSTSLSPGGRPAAYPFLLAELVALQGLWLGWWLAEPLPNSGNIGGRIYRFYLLSRTFPQVVPGVSYAQSRIGQIAGELDQPGNLVQRGPILLAAALIVLAGLGLGDLALRGLRVRSALSWKERVPLSFGLGMIALGLLTLGLGRAGLLLAMPIRGLLVLLAGWFAASTWVGPAGADDRHEDRRNVLPFLGFLAVTAPFVILMLLAAMLPTIDFDALEYHVQGPKESYLGGRIAFQPHNVYTSMPFGVEMLHLLGMVVLGDWWRGALVGQVVVMVHAPMAAAMIGLAASRIGSPRAGWVAAVAYLTTPWVFRLAALPYVEGPMCYYHAALIWAALRADSPRGWGLVGALAGGAMACKYPALISAVVPFGLAALASRSPKAVLGFTIGVAVVIGPWLAKNVVDTGNPVYPLQNGLFGGQPWSPQREAKWQAAHGAKPPSWSAFRDGVIDVAGRSDWQSGLYLALAPLAFLRRGSRRREAWLLAYVASIFGTWFFLTHRLDRFWLPVLPPLAVLAGLGADWTRGRVWTAWLGIVLFLVTVTNFAYATTPLTAFNEWTGDLSALRRRVPDLLNAPLAKMDRELPADARPLLVGQAAVFHLDHTVVFNTVFDDEILETLARDRTPEQVRRALLDRGITHIYVDWPEIARHRKPGGYGFTDFVQPEVFARWVDAGVLEPMPAPGPDRDLFRVRKP